MKKPSCDAQEDEFPSLKDRLLSVFLAPIMFNLAILIVMAVFFRHSRFMGRILYSELYLPGLLVWVTTILLPVIAGFLMGSNRFITLFGHFFYTHSEAEKDSFKTLVAWLGLFLIAYFVSDLI